MQALQGSDVTSTVTLRWWLTYASHEREEEEEKKNPKKPNIHTLFVLDDTSDLTLTCFVKTIPEEIKRHISQVKPET